MKSQNMNGEQMTFWQLIFSQSKANGAQYEGEGLPVCVWNWPTDTYLQRRRSSRRSTALHTPTHYLCSESGPSDIAAPVAY
jgi:hypothetical protein